MRRDFFYRPHLSQCGRAGPKKSQNYKKIFANDALYQLSYTPEIRTLHGMRGSHYGTKRKSGKRRCCSTISPACADHFGRSCRINYAAMEMRNRARALMLNLESRVIISLCAPAPKY
jgi:hypothetical protein